MIEVPFEDKDPYMTIPEGTYKAEPIEAKLLPTNDNQECSPHGNFFVSFTFRIMQEYQGKLIFGRYNVKHSTPQVQQIGQSQVRRVFKAVGVKPPEGTLSEDKLQVILNRPFLLKVSCEPDKYRIEKGYDDPNVNKPVGYIAINSSNQNVQQTTVQTQTPALRQEEKDFLARKNAEFDKSNSDIPF